MHTYWPWWSGAVTLAFVAVGYTASARRGFGVSGIYARLLNWREEREAEKVQKLFQAKLAASGNTSLPAPPTPISQALMFICFIFIGAVLSQVLTGGLELQTSLGSDFERLVGSGWSAWLALLLGGALVGFGTRMAGGCTSGHGLFGCGRMQPASLLATAAFFGAGVAVSFLLGMP